MDRAQRALHDEIKRLKATDLIISTNIPVRKDGMMYADYMSRKLDDPGVAIYFCYAGKSITMCCDQYLTVWENIYALAKGIEALRGMDRWGVSDFMDRVFTGFAALPPAQTQIREWWQVLAFESQPENTFSNWIAVKHNYRTLAKKLHPDAQSGDQQLFHELQEAYEIALTYFNHPD